MATGRDWLTANKLVHRTHYHTFSHTFCKGFFSYPNATWDKVLGM